VTLYSKTCTNVKFVASNEHDALIQYRKKNAQKRFDYYDLAHNNSHKQKMLITFTYSDENALFKMQVINDMRNHFNKLIRNLRNDNIKFFSNIELGENFDNPHVHIQLWFDDDADKFDISRVYDKVVAKYGLMSSRCVVSLDERETDMFHYVVKDYRKDIGDSELIELNSWKSFYRKELGKSIRFTSHSKGEHSKGLYKRAYGLGIKKYDLDWLIERGFVSVELVVCDELLALCCVERCFGSFLRQVYNKWIAIEFTSYVLSFEAHIDFEYWVFGFIDRLLSISQQNLIQRSQNVYIVNFSGVWLENVDGYGRESSTTAYPASINSPSIIHHALSGIIVSFGNGLFNSICTTNSPSIIVSLALSISLKMPCNSQ